MNKAAYWIIVFIALVSTTQCVFAVQNDTLYFNNTDGLPYRQVNLTVNLAKNYTVYLNRTDSESQLFIKYPNQTLLVNDSTQLIFNVSVNKSVKHNTTYTALFELTSTANNATFEYAIIANYTYKAPETIIDEPVFFMNLQDKDYLINISTDLLPKEGQLEYVINGPAGKVLNVSVPKGWLSFDGEPEFNQQNQTSFSIHYSIPADASLGQTIYVINFSTGNITRNATVAFVIVEPEIMIMRYTFRDECFVYSAEKDEYLVTMECLNEYDEYQITRISDLLRRLNAAEENDTCECEPVIEEKFVIAGNIEENVAADYGACRNERATCFEDRVSYLNQLNDCQDKLNNNETACLSTVFEASVRMKNESEAARKSAQEYVSSFKKTAAWTIGILAALTILSIIGIARYKKRKKWGYNYD